jgi:glycosyltransferase involved in cell wall biosynthesis
MKKILFLSHEATLTGAPIFLLRLIQYLDSTKRYKMLVLFNNSGRLFQEFQKHTSTMVLSNLNTRQKGLIKIFIRFFPMYTIRDIFFRIRIKLFQPDIIISNTLANSDLLPYINHLNQLKLITIVHEMKSWLNHADKLEIFDVNKSISLSSHFIAVSNSVKKNLLNDFKISEYNISMFFNNNNDFKPQKIPNTEMSKWKKDNNIPENTFIIGSCGSLIWRKGPDIFISILNSFKKKYPTKKIFFIWQGGQEKSSFYIEIENEINQLSLSNDISLLPFSSNTHFFYNAIDIYISTAREEPFGLTLLEAGSYKKPCIAFEKSGGPEEILSNNRGLLIPYGDVDNAVEAIFELMQNDKSSKKFSLELSKFVLENNSKNTFTNYSEIIDRFII